MTTNKRWSDAEFVVGVLLGGLAASFMFALLIIAGDMTTQPALAWTVVGLAFVGGVACIFVLMPRRAKDQPQGRQNERDAHPGWKLPDRDATEVITPDRTGIKDPSE